jgi:hypothetical protein
MLEPGLLPPQEPRRLLIFKQRPGIEAKVSRNAKRELHLG